MADILPFKRSRSQAQKQARKNARGLCQHGHHKWKVWKDKQFDVKQGKLITVYRCERCSKQKVKAH